MIHGHCVLCNAACVKGHNYCKACKAKPGCIVCGVPGYAGRPLQTQAQLLGQSVMLLDSRRYHADCAARRYAWARHIHAPAVPVPFPRR